MKTTLMIVSIIPDLWGKMEAKIDTLRGFCLFVCLFVWLFRLMVVLRLGTESELQLAAYATATAMEEPRCTCDLHHS